jgi:hypothetical protein
MDFRLALALLLVPAAAAAEENCGRVEVRTIRVDGTIEAIEPLVAAAEAIDVDEINPRFLVRLHPIENAGKVWIPEPLRSRRLEIAIHSPSRLGIERGPGHFQFESMNCDGSFRRFIGFGPVPEQPVEFDGWLDEGNLYRGEVKFEENFLQTAKPLKPPRHHLAGIHWVNLDEFPRLRDGARATIVFTVESRDTEHRGEREWWTTWDCRIREVIDSGAAAQ